jgi:hypothetical protein
MYKQLAGMELFLTKNKGFVKIRDGVFESDGVEVEDEEREKKKGLSPVVAAFFRSRFAIFNVPPVVGFDLRKFGINTGVLSPEMARSFLKSAVKREELEHAVR